MNLRELAAGVICVGFDGQMSDASFEAHLRALPLAGLILFGRNVGTVEETRALTDRLRTFFPGPDPILAIDQEGGRVARIRDGVVEIPSMMALAATGDVELARQAGAQIAHDLRRIGVNVDYAPVLDLALHRANTVIGARAFGDDPEVVTRFAGAVGEGLERGGVVATYKHFPGHGSTAADSHLELPVVDEAETVLRGRDLVPFAALLPGARAVMTAHIILRAFDGEAPATHASSVLQGLLREELHFPGVCFTDCMEMDAIAKTVGTAQGAVYALAAGADCVLISHQIDRAVEAVDRIVAAVESGALPEARLREAFGRVQTLRAGLQPPVDIAAPAPYPQVGQTIGLRAVTAIRGTLACEASSAAVVSFEGTTTEGVQGTHSLHTSLCAYVPGLQQLDAPLDPPAEALEKILETLEASGKTPLVLMRRAHIYEAQRRAVERILARHPDAVLVSVREPFDIESFPHARNLGATYGDDAPSMYGLAQVAFGHMPARGTFPVRWAAVR